MSLRSLIKSSPIFGPLTKWIRAPRPVKSSTYWESRYSQGGDSGAGSYNRLAAFKAEFLNDFVRCNGVESVIEFGSGDGAQLSLATYPAYVGVDVSRSILEVLRSKFAHQKNYVFLHSSEVDSGTKAELSLSLDVVYHLVEDEVFELYMQQLFDAALKWVIIYASDKNSWAAPHVRHRNFTRWVDKYRRDFTLTARVPNRYPYDPEDPVNTSFADFYVYSKTELPSAVVSLAPQV